MKNNRIPLLNILASWLILLFLVIAAGLNRSLQSDISLLQFGSGTLFLAAGRSLLGIICGALVALLLPLEQGPAGMQNGKLGLVFSSLLLVPALLLFYQLLLAFYGPVPALTQFWGQYRFILIDWLIYSQAIPLWAGVVLGWLVKIVFMSRK